MLKRLYCVICNNYRRLEIPKISCFLEKKYKQKETTGK